MSDLIRRDVLRYGSAVWLALAAPSAGSAEAGAPEPEKQPVRRPWADFEAARRIAKDANNSEAARELMIGELGPLPWRFFGDAEGYNVTVNALVDFEGDPNDAVGVFALAHAVHPTDPEHHPPRVLLLLCGRISMQQKILWQHDMLEFMDRPTNVFERAHRAAMMAAIHFPPA